MKKGIIYGALIVAFIALGFVLYKVGEQQGTVSEDDKEFHVTNTEDIARVYMADRSNNAVTLEKQANGEWLLNEKYKARQPEVEGLLQTIKQMRVRNFVSKSAHNNVVKMMAAENTKVELFDQDGQVLKSFFVGPTATNNRGNFMKLKGSKKLFVVHVPGFNGHLSSRFFTDEKNWRSREIFAYAPGEVQSIDVLYPMNPSEGFKLKRMKKDSFSVYTEDGGISGEVDQRMANTYVNHFQKLHAESFINYVSNKDSIINNSPPYSIITVTDKAGDQRELTVFLKPINKRTKKQFDNEGNPLQWDNDRYYGLINDREDLVIIQDFVFGKVFIGAQHFFIKNEMI